MSEADLVQRYRHLRHVAGEIQGAALDLVPDTTMDEFARRLGALRYGHIALDDDQDWKLLEDLAIHTARPGRSRALDRYARTAAFPAGSDQARVLNALRTARFRMFIIKKPHPVAGAVASDLIAEEEFHLMDISIGMTAAPGAGFIGRLAGIEGFHMSCLTLLPINPELIAGLMQHAPALSGTKEDLLNDPKLALTVYREAIKLGTMRRCVSFDPAREMPTQEQCDWLLETIGRQPEDLPVPMAAG